MATPNVGKIIRAPGRLVVNPANLSTPPAFGGTEIGIHRDIEIHYHAQYYWPKAEEFGMVPIDGIYCGQSVELKGYARGLDVEALQYFWPFSAAGAGGDRVISDNPLSGTKAGTLLSSLFNIKLMFVPKDYNRHPFVLIYRAMPWLDEAAAMPMSLAEELAYPVAFKGIPDATGRCYAMGRLSSISL